MPAMGVPARKYLPLAEVLGRKGYAIALFEWRGIETSSVRASRKDDFGYNEILNHDLPEAIKKVREVYPENPIYLLGHSLGGQLGFLLMCQILLHRQNLSIVVFLYLMLRLKLCF